MEMEAVVKKNALEQDEVIIREFNRVIVVRRVNEDVLEAEIWNHLAFDGEVAGGCAQIVTEGDYDDWQADRYFEVACQMLNLASDCRRQAANS